MIEEKRINTAVTGFIFLVLIINFSGCQGEAENLAPSENRLIHLEKIDFYHPSRQYQDQPFKSRLTYYFNDGRPHRWMELDSLGKPMIEYIYDYNDSGVQTGARYREPDMDKFDVERVRFENDSTQVTEWIDSTGTVFYTMVDNLNKAGKTYRATFIGDTVHGYDSTFYTREGFEKRIFFTSTKGKIMNDRSFLYDSVNPFNDWAVRRKIMDKEEIETQVRELIYDDSFTTSDSIYYPGVISSREWSENVISFSDDEQRIFFTRTSGWDHQTGFLAEKQNGLYNEDLWVKTLDSIYNGCISPDGKSIIYSKKQSTGERIFLIRQMNDVWGPAEDLSASSGIHGGYFHWATPEDIYFHIPDNKGDIVRAKIKDNQLMITDRLEMLNSKNGTEFSPFIDPESRFIIFTRYVEGDLNQQGFFISYNSGDDMNIVWTKAEKIQVLPYGWSARIINNGNRFVFTDGENIRSLPVNALKILK